MNMELTPAGSRGARAFLGLSQAAVAKGAEVNRTYLSRWENDSMILPEATQRRLRDFYEAEGYTFQEQHSVKESPAEPRGESPGAPVAPTAIEGPKMPDGVYHLDGYLIPSAIRPSRAERILEEMQTNHDAVVAFLGDSAVVEPVVMVEEGLLFDSETIDDTPVREQRAEAFNALRLMAMNWMHLIELHGSGDLSRLSLDIEVVAEETPEFLQTNAGVVSGLLEQGEGFHCPAFAGQ